VDGYLASFLGAAGACWSMLAQLCPTFGRLNAIAYHRDVNARNILVFSPRVESVAAPTDAASLLEFSLIDFGSSADSERWAADAGPGSWREENPTGDARYWGPASWFRFLGGPEALDQRPSLRRLYATRLDAFALAACALEMLAKLHVARCPPEAFKNALALGSFEHLAKYSQLVCRGDQRGASRCWDELTESDIAAKLGNHLVELCECISSLAGLCRELEAAAGAAAG